MAYSLIAQTSAINGATTTGAINTTGATLIVVVAAAGGSTTLTSDTGSNTFTVAVLSALSGQAVACTISYCYNPTTSATHTFTNTGAASVAFVVLAFSGAKSSPKDQSNSTADSLSPGSITPGNPNELVICGVGHGGSTGANMTSINGGFTTTAMGSNTGAFGVGAAYLIQTSAAAANPAWTGAGTLGPSTSIASFFAKASPSMFAVF